MRNLRLLFLSSIFVATISIAAPAAFKWNELRVMQNIPAGRWNLKFISSVKIKTNQPTNETLCATSQDIQTYLESQFRGAPGDTSQCPSKIITNFGDKADIDIICPAVKTAIYSQPALVVRYTIKRPILTLQNRVFEIREGNKVMQTTATYLGKCA